MSLRVFPNEEFREFEVHESRRLRYAVSNKGRLISFKNDISEGRELIGSYVDGYRMYSYRITGGPKIIYMNFFVCKIIAGLFMPKTSENQKYVLHLDYVRDHDDVKNLKWATYDEMIEHSRRSPHVIQAKKNLVEHNIKADGRKLTATKVILIKKLLNNPNRTTRLKMIAKQFGVSETHIKRIASGENWGHIKV